MTTTDNKPIIDTNNIEGYYLHQDIYKENPLLKLFLSNGLILEIDSNNNFSIYSSKDLGEG
jgi:hypothetical protein